MTFHRPLVFSPSDHFDSQSISLFLKTGSGPDVRVPDPRPSRGGDSAAAPAPACGGGSAEAPAEACPERLEAPPAPRQSPTGSGGGGAAVLRAGSCGGGGAGRERGAAGPPSLGETEARTGRAPTPTRPPCRFPAIPIFSHPDRGGRGCGEEMGEHSRVLFPVGFFCVALFILRHEKGGYAY